jgi:hypothetical protein
MSELSQSRCSINGMARLLHSDKQIFSVRVRSSGMCHLRTHAPQQTMCAGCSDLLDHPVGAGEQGGRRQLEAGRPGGLGVDHEFEFGRLLDRQIGQLRPAQNPVDELGGAPGPLKSMKATVPTGVENSYFS